MNLLALKVDLTRTADALERIANCLEQLLPPMFPAKAPAKEYPIEQATNESTYEYEMDEQLAWYKDKVELLMKEYGDKLDGS